MELKEHITNVIGKTYGQKVHLCPRCLSVFAWESAPRSTKCNPTGSWRLRNAEDVCNCVEYKRAALNPQPKIEVEEFLDSEGKKKQIIVIKPIQNDKKMII